MRKVNGILEFWLLIQLIVFSAAASFGQEAPVSLEDIQAYHKISDSLSTSGQVLSDQIPRIRQAGFQVVVNLAPADEKRNQQEGFRVVQEGMTYIQIPVSWQNPELRDLQLFFDVMEANRDRKVYVHCFANMRVSVFVFLYRTLLQNVTEEDALSDLHKIWNPDEQTQWAEFIQAARKKFTRQR